jgi:predicted DNA-binding protein (UPF0251 family)
MMVKMNPKKLIRHIDPKTFKKSKVFYHKLEDYQNHEAALKINLDEYEALRLYHYKHLTQAECAKNLKISQPTFSRILRSGMDKLVKALVEEKDFEILGGNVTYNEWKGWGCWDCDYEWKSKEKPKICPNCKSTNTFHFKKLVSYFTKN